MWIGFLYTLLVCGILFLAKGARHHSVRLISVPTGRFPVGVPASTPINRQFKINTYANSIHIVKV